MATIPDVRIENRWRIRWDFYRRQTKLPKGMFLHLSVSHSVHKGGGKDTSQADIPLGRHPHAHYGVR